MARPRTPTSVLEDRGSFINRPARKEERANEPEPRLPIPANPPKEFELNPDEQKIWRQFVKIAPPGVFADCDKYWLAELCRIELKARKRTMTNAERSHYIIFLSRIGFNPSERSKVVALPHKKEDDDWSDLETPNKPM